MQGIKKQNQKN